MADYDPVPDAIGALNTKTASQRHAMARLVEPGGPSLQVLRWIIEQPDCDIATASMVFLRLLRLPDARPGHSILDRVPVLDLIRKRVRAAEYKAKAIAWDGLEVWDRTPLLAGAPLPGLNSAEIPLELLGPFHGETPEPATHAFLDSSYDEDDIFDSLWRVTPQFAAASDWLVGKSADVWMIAAGELEASHPNELYLWMVQQPECPAPVAGQIFWMRDPLWYSQGMLSESLEKPTGVYADVFSLLGPILDRWRGPGFATSDLDFCRWAATEKYRKLLSEYPGKSDPLAIPVDLLDPRPGRLPSVLRLTDDFNFWCIQRNLASLVPRPRSADTKEWEESLKPPAPEPKPKSGWKLRDLFR